MTMIGSFEIASLFLACDNRFGAYFTLKSYFFLKHGQPNIIKVSGLVKIVLLRIDFIKAAVTCAEIFVHDTN